MDLKGVGDFPRQGFSEHVFQHVSAKSSVSVESR